MTVPDSFDEDLFQAARAASRHAHAPYSGFAVGAALRLAGGQIITGANFENASLGLSLCAETVALATANSQGRLGDVVAIAIAGSSRFAETPGTLAPLTPCGRCRQILAEAASLAGEDIRVYCADAEGEKRTIYRVSELLPHAFSAAAFARGSED